MDTDEPWSLRTTGTDFFFPHFTFWLIKMSHPVQSHYIVSFEKESINSHKKGQPSLNAYHAAGIGLCTFTHQIITVSPVGGHYHWSPRSWELGRFPWGHTARGRDGVDRLENPYSYPYLNHAIYRTTWEFAHSPNTSQGNAARCRRKCIKSGVRHTWGWVPSQSSNGKKLPLQRWRNQTNCFRDPDIGLWPNK